MQPLPSNFPEKERLRFWARKKKEHEMDIPRVVMLPIQAIEQGRAYAHNNRIETSVQVNDAQLKDIVVAGLELMRPAARALVLEQISPADDAPLVAELLEALRMVTNVYASMRSTLAEKYPKDGWSASTMTLDHAHAVIAKATGYALLLEQIKGAA